MTSDWDYSSDVLIVLEFIDYLHTNTHLRLDVLSNFPDLYPDQPGFQMHRCHEARPFYGVKIYPGELGTKGGLQTDTRTRVLDGSVAVIEGLYANHVSGGVEVKFSNTHSRAYSADCQLRF